MFSKKTLCEMYTLRCRDGNLLWEPREDDVLMHAIIRRNVSGYTVVCAMGDENLLFCTALRKNEGVGGIFVLAEGDTLLLVAVAENTLSYVEGLGHYAGLVAQPRYAVDIFENVDGDA